MISRKAVTEKWLLFFFSDIVQNFRKRKFSVLHMFQFLIKLAANGVLCYHSN